MASFTERKGVRNGEIVNQSERDEEKMKEKLMKIYKQFGKEKQTRKKNKERERKKRNKLEEKKIMKSKVFQERERNEGI